MSPGRASAASTTCRLSCLASACWTQVCTAAQPVPGILWPDCSSDHVTKLAHHGLPGPTLAAARYLSTIAPVLAPPVSWTPSCVWAICRAAAPTGLPPPAVTAAASTTAPGTASGFGASAPGGPAGARTARKLAVWLPAPEAAAVGAKNVPVSEPEEGGAAAVVA